MRAYRPPFALHFSGTAWSQIGAMDATHFETLQHTLEYFAEVARLRLERGARPVEDEHIPVAAGSVVADCTFSDYTRSITVRELEYWDRLDRRF